jgi:hypothetical protein
MDTAIEQLEQPTPEQLRELIKKHGITRADAASMVHVSTNAWHKWSATKGSMNAREIPMSAWELLLLKLDEHPTKRLVDR